MTFAIDTVKNLYPKADLAMRIGKSLDASLIWLNWYRQEWCI